MHLSCKSQIDFNEAFILYNELQFLDWPSTVAELIYIANGLVILIRRNIKHYLNDWLH